MYTSTVKTIPTTNMTYSHQTSTDSNNSRLTLPIDASFSTRASVSASRKSTNFVITTTKIFTTKSYQNSTNRTSVNRIHNCSNIQIDSIPEECIDGIPSTFKVGYILYSTHIDTCEVRICSVYYSTF